MTGRRGSLALTALPLSVLEVPLLALPLVAWVARRRPAPGPLVASPATASRWLLRGRGLLQAWRGGTAGQAGR